MKRTHVQPAATLMRVTTAQDPLAPRPKNMSVPLKKEEKKGSLYRSILDTPDSYQSALEAIITEHAWVASYKVITADADTSNKNHQKILLRN